MTHPMVPEFERIAATARQRAAAAQSKGEAEFYADLAAEAAYAIADIASVPEANTIWTRRMLGDALNMVGQRVG